MTKARYFEERWTVSVAARRPVERGRSVRQAPVPRIAWLARHHARIILELRVPQAGGDGEMPSPHFTIANGARRPRVLLAGGDGAMGSVFQ
jgi:hypothetical protein